MKCGVGRHPVLKEPCEDNRLRESMTRKAIIICLGSSKITGFCMI